MSTMNTYAGSPSKRAAAGLRICLYEFTHGTTATMREGMSNDLVIDGCRSIDAL